MTIEQTNERTELKREIDRLSPTTVTEVLDFVGYLRQKKERVLEKAAGMAAGEYAADPELTAFSALDGADFYEYGDDDDKPRRNLAD
ncbi:hypothetical protein FACS189444_6370 [Spirochaetia bacterium]|nr:hypothetical protein FACS189444_6370 [Spirochaetia bacterium]